MAFYHSIHSQYRGVKGFVSVYRQGLRYRDMITKKALKEARILDFWQEHGLKTTIDAFEVSKKLLMVNEGI